MIVVSHRFRVRQALLGTALAIGGRDRAEEAGKSAGDAYRDAPVPTAADIGRLQTFAPILPELTLRLESTRPGS